MPVQPPQVRTIRARHLAGLWLLAFATSAAVGTHGPVYWDAGDYVWLAIKGEPTGLLLGRPLFLLVSRGILATGLDPAWAEPVLRWFWAAVSATAAPLLAVLCARLDLPARAALAAGVALALSPSFAHTSHQVLTDGPALALAIGSLALAARRDAVGAGVMLAAAIAMRETAAVQVIAMALLLGRRWIAGILSAAATLAVILWIFPPAGLRHWAELMSQHPNAARIDLSLVGVALIWVFATGPFVVATGIVSLFRGARGRWFLASLPSAVATLPLLFYPDGSFSPRYMLATVPIAFFPAAASWLAASTWRAALVLLTPLIAMPWITQQAREMVRYGEVAQARAATLPRDALVMPGHYCPQARLGAAIASRHDLQFVCPGWGWPGDVDRVLDEALQSHRPMALDLSDTAWRPPHEITLLQGVRAWALRQGIAHPNGFVLLQR